VIRIQPLTYNASPKNRIVLRIFVFLIAFISAAVIAGAQNSATDDKAPYIVDGTAETDVFGMGRSIVVRGTVKHGAMAFGGDVIVEGTVEGDVAAIGGSVRQKEGARIGGDVLVIGGGYLHQGNPPNRDPSSTTVMIAGYEQELRSIMRDPTSLLTASWSLAYLGQRLLSVLFWFIASLAITAVTPGAVSRAVARLQLTNVRVAVIGLLASVVVFVGIPVVLKVLPTPISVLVMIMSFLLLLVALLFGRVVIHAATGQWLQRRFCPEGLRSESMALLCGAAFWTLMLSLPYVWPVIVAGLMIASLGLTLTARYRVTWKREQQA
jgi:hypothetical protein